MSDQAVEHSKGWQRWWRWLVYTPLKDWSRGKLTARLDLKSLVARSELPEELKTIVYNTTRRARLWRGERIDAAQELINHFTDGLNAGHSAAELRESFGDWKIAAKLIARAKRRARPLWLRVAWPIVKTAAITVAALAVLTGIAVARYSLVRPIADVSFTESLNEQARKVAEADRAWPLYNRANGMLVDPERKSPVYRDARRQEWADFAHDHQEIVELIREAAAKPRLGFYFRRLGEPPLKGVTAIYSGAKNPDDFEDGGNRFLAPERYGALEMLQPISHRPLIQLLNADIWNAERKEDSQAVLADLRAMIGMANQSPDGFPVLMAYQIRFEILLRMLDAVGELLADRGSLFSDPQLRELSQLIGSLSDASLRVDLSTVEKIWNESCANKYASDGFLTAAEMTQIRGFQILPGLDGLETSPRWSNRAIAMCIEAWLPLVALRLGQAIEFGDQMFDETTKYQDIPLWERSTAAPGSGFFRSFWDSGKLYKLRWEPAMSLNPWRSELIDVRHQQVLQRRDAILAAIALELYHRAHREWPKTLGALVPEFLTAVPLDRFDGTSLKYVLRDGRPVLYSVGSDRIDDGGVAPKDIWWIQYWHSPQEIETSRRKYPERIGDWILWPPLESEKADSRDL